MLKSRPADFDVLAAPPRVLLASFYPFAARQAAGPFWNESSGFVSIVRGRGVIQIGPTRFDVSSGQVVHVPWSRPFRFEADSTDPFSVLGVHLSYEPWSGSPPGALRIHTENVDLARTAYQTPPHPQLFTDAFLIDTPLDSPLPEIAASIAHAYETGIADAAPSMRETRLRGLALTFIAEFYACMRTGARRVQSRADAAQARMVREIASYMELNLANPRMLHRAALAARAAVSETKLAEAFRAVTGRGPIDYLIEIRIAYARRALRASRTKVGEIAAQVGIPNLYYFSKLFKRRVGCSPLHYRTRMKTGITID